MYTKRENGKIERDRDRRDKAEGTIRKEKKIEVADDYERASERLRLSFSYWKWTNDFIDENLSSAFVALHNYIKGP